jgi:cell division protein FtsB
MKQEALSRQAVIATGLAVIAVMAGSFIVSYYRNVLFEQSLLSIKDSNLERREHNAALEKQLQYYGSTQYLDRVAKENLGKKNPGEQVIIVKEINPTPLLPINTDTSNPIKKTSNINTPIVEHWVEFLFKKQREQV